MSNTHSSSFIAIFPTVPQLILNKLEQSYNSIKKNYQEGRYEPSELNGAKFCEAVYRLLEWYASPTKSHTPFGTKINDFGQSVKKFESMSKLPDSVRFHIPKILDALYGIRNKRGVGHLGGDVDPNYMDSVFVVSSCDWVMAELVRLFHGLNPNDAQRLVQNLVTKKLPIVWRVDKVKRVLAVNLSYRDKTLVLLYDEYPRSVTESELLSWVEHSNLSVFRRDILKPCHKKRLVEYNQARGKITLSPLGLQFVEKNIKLEV